MTQVHTNGAATKRVHRFSKALYDSHGTEVDGTSIDEGTALGIEVDGRLVKLVLSELSEEAFMRLAIDGLYDKLTRAIHASKPKAVDTDSAIKVMEDTFAQIKTGKFKKGRKGGIRGPKTFDEQRFRDAVLAGAKGNGVKVSEEKFERLLSNVKTMSGKDRQKYINDKFMKDPYFKTQWEKPVLEAKKAKIKSGEVESMFSDLN